MSSLGEETCYDSIQTKCDVLFVRVNLGQLALFLSLKTKDRKLHTLDFHTLSGLTKWKCQKSEYNLLFAYNPLFYRLDSDTYMRNHKSSRTEWKKVLKEKYCFVYAVQGWEEKRGHVDSLALTSIIKLRHVCTSLGAKIALNWSIHCILLFNMR